MRDAGPLILDLLINDHILAEVIHDQTLVQLVQAAAFKASPRSTIACASRSNSANIV